MFETLFEISKNEANYADLFEKITEITNSYSQSARIAVPIITEHLLPIFEKILANANISIVAFNSILESMVRLLKVGDLCVQLMQLYDLASVLNKVIGN